MEWGKTILDLSEDKALISGITALIQCTDKNINEAIIGKLIRTKGLKAIGEIMGEETWGQFSIFSIISSTCGYSLPPSKKDLEALKEKVEEKAQKIWATKKEKALKRKNAVKADGSDIPTIAKKLLEASKKRP